MSDRKAQFWQRLEKYLEERTLKQTTQRKVIGECMLKMNRKHFDAEQLHQALRDDDHDIGLATVYRTLNLFKDAGIIHHQVFSGGNGFFEVDEINTHHDHLFCSECSRVIEFESDEIERLQAAIAKKYGFELIDHRLDLWGRCLTPDCKWKKPAIKS